MDVFADYAYYYNSFYKDKDYFGEAQKVNQLLYAQKDKQDQRADAA